MAVYDTSNMELILNQEKALGFFLNVTIPAALKRCDPIPHTLIICDYPRLAKAIASHISSQIPSDLLFPYSVSHTAPGDVAAVLTSLPKNSVLFLEKGSSLNRLQLTAIDVLQNAIKDGHIEVKIGSGVSARTHILELPDFSFIAILENHDQISPLLKHAFENIINISSLSKSDLCALEVDATAREYNLDFADDAIAEIVRVSNGNYRTSSRIVRRIRDYIFIQNDHYEQITRDYVTKILELI